MSSEERAPEAERGERPARRAALLLALALLVGAVLAHAWPRRAGPIDLHYDGATYYVLGAALADGQGYRLANEPGAIEALQYPPLFPLWIAAHMRLVGSTDPAVVAPWLRGSQLLVALGYALAVFALARRWFALPWALLTALLTTLSFRTIYLSDLLFPELLFATVSVLFFLASSSPRAGVRRLAGPLAAAAYLLRTLGVTLLAAWVLAALCARRWRAAGLRLAVALLPIVLWQANVRRVESSAEYRTPHYAYQRAPYLYGNVSYARNLFLVDPFAPERGMLDADALAWRVLDNARHLPTFVGEIVLAPLAEWVWPVRVVGRAFGCEPQPEGLFLFALALAGLGSFAGLVGLARHGQIGVALYVLLSLALIALTPWQAQFWRYMTPLVPFLAAGFVWMLWAGWRASDRLRHGRRAARAALVLVASGAVGAQAQSSRSMFERSWRPCAWTSASGRTAEGRAFYLEREWQAFEDALGWLRAHARQDEVVACSVPQLAWLGTGLRAVLPPFEADPAAARAALDSVPVRYVIVDELEFLDVARRYLRPMLAAQPESWELVHRPHEWSSLSVWRRRVEPQSRR